MRGNNRPPVNKMCPILTGAAMMGALAAGKPPAPDCFEVSCKGGDCAFWVRAYAYESGKPAGTEGGCCFSINAQTDGDGRIQL